GKRAKRKRGSGGCGKRATGLLRAENRPQDVGVERGLHTECGTWNSFGSWVLGRGSWVALLFLRPTTQNHDTRLIVAASSCAAECSASRFALRRGGLGRSVRDVGRGVALPTTHDPEPTTSPSSRR